MYSFSHHNRKDGGFRIIKFSPGKIQFSIPSYQQRDLIHRFLIRLRLEAIKLFPFIAIRHRSPGEPKLHRYRIKLRNDGVFSGKF